MKTRLEVAREEADAQDVSGAVTELESGVQYQDIRLGGGRLPQKRDLVVLDFRYEPQFALIHMHILWTAPKATCQHLRWLFMHAIRGC